MHKLGLREEIRKQLGDEAGRGVSILESWPLNQIAERVITRLSWTKAYANAVELEYRRFLVLAFVNPDVQFGMSKIIDEFWHEHILDTRNYLHMCSTIGRVIHHIPSDTDAQSDENICQVDTVRSLHRYFVEPCFEFWPRVQDGQCGGGSNCASCNKSVSKMPPNLSC